MGGRRSHTARTTLVVAPTADGLWEVRTSLQMVVASEQMTQRLATQYAQAFLERSGGGVVAVANRQGKVREVLPVPAIPGAGEVVEALTGTG